MHWPRISTLPHNEQGGVAIVFGLSLLMLATAAGLAVDFASLNRVDTDLQGAADAAALNGAATARDYMAKHGAQDEATIGQASQLARESAAAYFAAEVQRAGEAAVSVTFDVEVEGGRVSVKSAYSGTIETSFARIAGYESLPVSGEAVAVAGLPPFVEITLLIDTSGSMAIGASAADQSFLTANTGCVFACHDNNPVHGYADSYAYAIASGVKLRHTAINAGIVALMDRLDELDSGHNFIKTSLLSFDNNLTVGVTGSTDTGAIRSALPASPAISGETEGATRFKEIIGDVVDLVGTGGDGKSAANPKKILIIATDGAQDPGRYWTSVIAARTEVDAFDMSFCQGLKDSGVQVGIIHTPYIPVPSDWGYMATLGMPSQKGGPDARVDDIAPALQDCAGSLYIAADDTPSIKSAFTAILSALNSTYLVK